MAVEAGLRVAIVITTIIINNKVILIVILIKITTEFIFMTVFPEIF
jgi:hypothetical protein